MSYFDENNLERVRWRCSLNLEKYFEKPLRGFYNKEHEYVATWYENRLSLDKSKTLVEVTFINLTNPTYINKKTGEEYQSFFKIALPINYLHKIPFGSIWKNGESEYKFKLKEFKVTFSKSKGLAYKALWTDKESPHPFEADKYVYPSYLRTFKGDGNQLLVIKPKGDSKSYIVHPLHFFMAHYGYSSELKRILITDNWGKVEKKLHLNEFFKEKGVFVPNNLSTKDAVFLYHLKHDAYTKAVVKDVTAKIIFSKGQENPNYLIPCWHDKSIMLSFYGIELGNSVLCCQITGISQLQGEPINLYYSAIKVSKDGKGQGINEPQYRMRKQEREHELEKLDIALDNVNNLVTADVIEHLKLLGEERKINRIQLVQEAEKGGKVKFLNYDEPKNYGVGEKQGKTGNTGIANCFYDISNDSEFQGKSRLDTVWEHAKRLRYEKGAKVYWYTPKSGFHETDDFKIVSLQETLDSLGQSYPIAALILCVNVQQRTFFVLSFPARNERENSGYSSIVYEPQDIKQFLSGEVDIHSRNENLFKLFVEIISSDGVSSDYVDSKGGKMSLFRHVTANKIENNWVWNGIKKLL